MDETFTIDQIEGLVNNATAGDRHAARRLFAAIGHEHYRHQDAILETLARLDSAALWEQLLLFLSGQGWHGHRMPTPHFGIATELYRLFVQSFGQPLTLRQRAVCTALDHRLPVVRALASTLAGRQRNVACVPRLSELLHDAYPEVRIAAAHALTTMPNAANIPTLLQNMEDRDFGVRWASVEALCAVGRPALAPLLHYLIENRLSPAFRETAAHAVPVLALGAEANDINALMNALHGTAAGAAVPVAADRLLCWVEAGGRRSTPTPAPAVAV